MWEYTLGNFTHVSAIPSVSSSNGMIYLATGSYLFAIDAVSGSLMWTHSLASDDGVFLFSPIAIGPDDTVFTSTSLHAISLDGTTGALRWQRPDSVLLFPDCFYRDNCRHDGFLWMQCVVSC